jgi:hypothetical protein
MKQLASLILILFSWNSGSAQTEEFQPAGSFKAEIGLANNLSNVAFSDLMQGLFNITAGYQYTLPNSLSFGAGVRHNYFTVNQFKNNNDLRGGIHFGGVYGKIGIEKYYGQFGIDIGVRVGYNMIASATNKCKEANEGLTLFDGGFIEPVINLGLLADERSSFYLNLTYALHTIKFNPYHVCEDDFSAYSPEGLDKITTYFVIGFGYSFYFGK